MQPFTYSQTVILEFGSGKLNCLGSIAEKEGYERGVLICSGGVVDRGVADRVRKICPQIKEVYSGVTPNPLLSEVEEAAEIIRRVKADFIVAVGGGSVLDLAKFASLVGTGSRQAVDYFSKKSNFTGDGAPLIAVPTTAGTGSEVTNVAVINDGDSGIKAPFVYKNFFPKYAVVDPELTLSAPPYVTAVTGMDAIAHALEAYWCIKHQPICDMFATEALKLLFGNLERAFLNGNDLSAREALSEGSLLAGLAFAPTRTAGVHGASYPLSMDYHLTHGEACAFTLDAFIRLNSELDEERMTALSKALGFSCPYEMSEEVKRLKTLFRLKTTLADIGVKDVEGLAAKCAAHPLTANNPGKLTADDLLELLKGI